MQLIFFALAGQIHSEDNLVLLGCRSDIEYTRKAAAAAGETLIFLLGLRTAERAGYDRLGRIFQTGRQGIGQRQEVTFLAQARCIFIVVDILQRARCTVMIRGVGTV